MDLASCAQWLSSYSLRPDHVARTCFVKPVVCSAPQAGYVCAMAGIMPRSLSQPRNISFQICLQIFQARIHSAFMARRTSMSCSAHENSEPQKHGFIQRIGGFNMLQMQKVSIATMQIPGYFLLKQHQVPIAHVSYATHTFWVPSVHLHSVHVVLGFNEEVNTMQSACSCVNTVTSLKWVGRILTMNHDQYNVKH
jgi:hypothetical protein